MRLWHWTTARVLYTATIFLLVLYSVRAAKETLTLLIFAILFAYFLLPLVNRLQKPLRGRGKAILDVYQILIAVLVGLGFLVGPKISHESQDLVQLFPPWRTDWRREISSALSATSMVGRKPASTRYKGCSWITRIRSSGLAAASPLDWPHLLPTWGDLYRSGCFMTECARTKEGES